MYADRLNAWLFAALVLAGVVIALLLIRPPAQVIEDPYRAKYEALQLVTKRYQLTADSAIEAANYHHAIAEILAAKRQDTPAHVRDAERALRGVRFNDAGVDSLQTELKRKP